MAGDSSSGKKPAARRRVVRGGAQRGRGWVAEGSCALYEGELVQAILLLKFERIEPLGEWFAERLAEAVRNNPDLLAADVVVPVPLHRERERERGYNQADLIAKPLAKRLQLPHKAV